MPDHKIWWCVVRVVEYQLAFLEYPDTYAPLSRGTWVTTDREEAYQTARAQRGLLVKVSGLPDESTLNDFTKAVSACHAEDPAVNA